MSVSCSRLALPVVLAYSLGCSSSVTPGGEPNAGQVGSGGASSASGGTSGGGSANSGGSNSTAGTTSSNRGGAGSGGLNNSGGSSPAGANGNGGSPPAGGSTSTSGGATTPSNGGRASGGRTGSAGNASGGSPGGGTGGVAGGGNASGGAPVAGNTGAGGSPGACGPIAEQLTSVTVTAPEGVRAGVRNFRIWGSTSLNVAPVYTVPLANCGTLVCYTTSTGSGSQAARRARVARLDAEDKLVTTHDLGAYECRGLAAEPDGHFGALLWAPGTATDCKDIDSSGSIYVSRFDVSGTQLWSKELTNTSTSGLGPNCPTDFGIGESRLEFGAGKYGAYYHVHSQSGHEGDTLKYVDLSGAESTTWSWGCSHSMSNVLRFNPTDAKFLPACVTDCYPGTGDGDFSAVSIGGIYLNNKTKVLDVDAGCNGSVAGELGAGAVAPSGWKLIFNAHQAPAKLGDKSYDSSTMNQDIGFASVSASSMPGAVKWLTTTGSINEADSAIERLKLSCDSTEQYLVGWAEPGTAYKYKLGRVSATGDFVEAPVDVTAKAKWGRRDDPFRAHVNGDIVWAWFDAAGSTSLHFARVRSGGTAQCAAF